MNKNLFDALRSVFFDLNDNDLIENISSILAYVLENNKITTRIILNLSDKNYEDVLFILFEKRLLIPENSYRGLEWQECRFSLDMDQTYRMPIIIKNLVKFSMKSGIWNLEEAILHTFIKIGDKNYKKMPILVHKLYEKSKNYRIKGKRIREICMDLGLEERTSALISELKGVGIMSPELSRSLFSSLKEKTPIYELNPSLYQ
ncbi:MAG: hypothetical protein ACQERB_05165 [Promethearchaeati archaeon]